MDHSRTYAQAIAEASCQAMEMDESVFVVGQGTRDRGHIFGSVEGLLARFGPQRVVEMPISENAVAGICVGAALSGLRPILVLQRADFSFLALDQLINHASKFHYMFGGQTSVPLVVRLIVGKGWGQGPQHSQSLHSMFAHFPGLRVVAPADPHTAKGLLLNAVFANDPVIILEGRPLYGTAQVIPEEPYTVPFGQARGIREGTDITIIAVSFVVPEAIIAADDLSRAGLSAEVIDLVSVNPLDIDTIVTSVQKTGRLLVVDTSWSYCGISAEISAVVHEKLFGELQSPVRRLTIPFTPTPTAFEWEDRYYPTHVQIAQWAQEMICGAELCPTGPTS
ncbi:MAG: alpha-ketoacid dehydrogenase subunit beta [Acidobacteriia bacterium]|nr:alpha-ketoacid dehydrogenase subunit beta [Terriglobia bacterium]